MESRDVSFRISQDRRSQLVEAPCFTDKKARAQKGELTSLASQISILEPDLNSSSESKPRDLLAMHPMAILPIMYYGIHKAFKTLWKCLR